MKNKKYFLIPITVFVFSFILLKIFDVSYSASNANYSYQYIRRNMLSHHFISSNGGNASGTILIKDGNRSSNDGTATLVYCAKRGKKISGASGYSKENISSSGYSTDQQNRLKAILMNSYPYISLAELKNNLKATDTGIGASVYADNLFDTLDVQEAMTATQAAIWNVVDNTTRYRYDTTKNISSVTYKYFNVGRVNWQNCASYNFQGYGAKSTILQDGDTQSSVCAYKARGTSKLDTRINALIDWYLSLTSTTSSNNDVTSFAYSNAVWENIGSKLTVNIRAVGNLDYNNSNYQIKFTDLNGNVIDNSNISATPITESGAIKGYTYVIDGITTKGVNANISITKTGLPTNVYYYRPKNNSSQAFIGIDSGNISITNNLTILNDGTGQLIVYKVRDSETGVSYTETTQSSASQTTTDNLCATGSVTCLQGAYIALYSRDKTTVIKEFVSSATAPEIITDLPDGIYYIKELTPPIGYLPNEEFLEVIIENGNIATATINNDPTKICFEKVSSANGETLDGAKFRVEGAEGGTFEEFTTSSQQDLYCIEGQLESGYYYLVEEEAPENFVKSNIIYKFSVGKFDPNDIVDEIEEGENVVFVESNNDVITITNKPGVVITKSDLSTGGCVEGAKLVVKDQNGNVVDEWTSSCDVGSDSHEISLDPGTYTLTEEITPEGYATAETITFTVDSNGNVDTSLDMKDAPIEACILKTSEDSEEGLPGGEFEIYKEDGTLYEKFTSDYVATCFPYMPVGTYTIKEVKAPEGYKISNEEITITVEDTSERQIFEITNELDVPKTSLDYSRIIIIIASVFMVFGVCLVGYYGYKKQK